MARIVLKHALEGDIYRLVVGEEVWEEQAAPTDEDPDAMQQVLVGHANVEDFVFAADDERWEGMDSSDVAAAQRTIVSEALDARADVEDETPDEHPALPGVGEEL